MRLAHLSLARLLHHRPRGLCTVVEGRPAPCPPSSSHDGAMPGAAEQRRVQPTWPATGVSPTRNTRVQLRLSETACGGGVEFLCSHETTAQCCDSSFSVSVAQLVVSVLISPLTSHAGLESYPSQTHLPSQRAQHTCDTCLTLHGSGAEELLRAVQRLGISRETAYSGVW